MGRSRGPGSPGIARAGSTTAGITRAQVGTVIGACGKASWLHSSRLIRSDYDKIEQFNELEQQGVRLGVASSGVVDAWELMNYETHWDLEVYHNNNDIIQHLGQRLSAQSKEAKWSFEQVFGGLENTADGPRAILFRVMPGSLETGSPYYCNGTGGPFARHVMRCIPTNAELTIDDMIAYVERALVYGAICNHDSGGQSKILIFKVNHGGESPEVKTEDILTTLLQRHREYFENRCARFGNDDPISRRVVAYCRLNEASQNTWRTSLVIFEGPLSWMDGPAQGFYFEDNAGVGFDDDRSPSGDKESEDRGEEKEALLD